MKPQDWSNAGYKEAAMHEDSAFLPILQPLFQISFSSDPPVRELADRAIFGGLCKVKSRVPGSFAIWLLSPWSSY